MTLLPSIEVLRALPPGMELRLDLHITAGELADALERRAHLPPPAEKRRLTVRDVATMRGCSLTTARTLFPFIPGANRGNGRDWECTPDGYSQFEAGLASGAIVLPRRKKKGAEAASARAGRPRLSAWREPEEAAQAVQPRRRAAGGGR